MMPCEVSLSARSSSAPLFESSSGMGVDAFIGDVSRVEFRSEGGTGRDVVSEFFGGNDASVRLPITADGG